MNIRGSAFLIGRLALAAGFLSAVADRVGLWGPPGSHHVAWGDWAHFSAYVAVLNPFAPAALVPFLAWTSTIAELGLGLLLLAGYRLRWTAYASAALLFLFGLAMTFAVGIKAPLDYSVFSAAAAALLVATAAPELA